MSTAVDYTVPIPIGYGRFLWVPVCRCGVAERDTGGSWWCPYHKRIWGHIPVLQPKETVVK